MPQYLSKPIRRSPRGAKLRSWRVMPLLGAWLWGALVPAFFFWFVLASHHAAIWAGTQSLSMKIMMKQDAVCTSNLIRLSDVADYQGSESARQVLDKITLGPAPQVGKTFEFTRDDVQKQLQLRGMEIQAFHWGGAKACVVRRMNDTPPPSTVPITSTQITPMLIKTAQRNVETAVRTYLKLQDEQSHNWKIDVLFPESEAKLLSDRRAIVGIGGGESPWEGEQKLVIQVRTATGERQIEIMAHIELPQFVAASKKAKRSGEVLSAEDLILLPYPTNSKNSMQDCFQDVSDLVGKELRRAMATNQILVRTDVGPPRVIETGEIVEVEVVSGGVSVTTAGKSLQSGGIGDAIQIEVIPHKKRLVAQVISDRHVRVTSAAVP